MNLETSLGAKILFVEDDLGSIENIQGILWKTPHLCAITLKWALQALKEIIHGTVQKMAFIIDGDFFNFRNSWDMEEFFHDSIDLIEWRDWLNDGKHYSNSEAMSYMDSIFSSEDFSLKDENGENAYRRYLQLNPNSNSPGSFFIWFVLRVLQASELTDIPLCFLLNSSKDCMNEEMARIISEGPLNWKIDIIRVPRWDDGWSKKNSSDSINELLRWVQQNG